MGKGPCQMPFRGMRDPRLTRRAPWLGQSRLPRQKHRGHKAASLASGGGAVVIGTPVMGVMRAEVVGAAARREIGGVVGIYSTTRIAMGKAHSRHRHAECDNQNKS